MAFTAVEVALLAAEAGFRVGCSQVLKPRAPRHLPLPKELDARVKGRLAAQFPDGVYAHQALALSALLEKKDVCLATATASGKSLVFMAAAAHLLLTEPAARVIALYPLRALLADQHDKWKALLGPLGLSVGLVDGGVDGVGRGACSGEGGGELGEADVRFDGAMAAAAVFCTQ